MLDIEPSSAGCKAILYLCTFFLSLFFTSYLRVLFYKFFRRFLTVFHEPHSIVNTGWFWSFGYMPFSLVLGGISLDKYFAVYVCKEF